MKKSVKIISIIMAVMLFVTTFTSTNLVSAGRADDIRNEMNDLEQESKKLEAEIKDLKGKINEQQKLKTAIESKMAVVQKQINACNKQINLLNSQIAANKAEIEKNNKEIENSKLSFKKRLRAIYMSNTGSNIQILLGAEDFAEFLQLAQLTASVSAHDKKMIEDLVAQIKALEEKQKANDKLLEEQVAIKETIAQKQAELSSQEREIQSVINSINADKKEVENDNARIERELKAMQDELNDIVYGSGSTNVVYKGDQFLWPTPTISRISSYFGPRWGKNHNGIDISNGTYGAKVIAIADGVVETYNNGCTHNYGKKPLYTCCDNGGGYGKYITINHGTKDGKTYVAYYAHLGSIAVSKGQSVKKGQVVGYVGSTGRSTGAHLHFGILVNKTWKDPMSFYRKVG